MALCRIGRVDDGLKNIEEAIRLKPDLMPARLAHAATLLRLGQVKRAGAELDQVLRLQPGNPVARRMLDSLRTTPGP